MTTILQKLLENGCDFSTPFADFDELCVHIEEAYMKTPNDDAFTVEQDDTYRFQTPANVNTVAVITRWAYLIQFANRLFDSMCKSNRLIDY